MFKSIKVLLRQLKDKGFFHILLGGTFSKLVAFISSIVIVRLVSKEEYAALAYADNIYSYVVLFSGMGMASAILKYCVSDNNIKNMAYYKFAFKYGSIFQLSLMFLILIYMNTVVVPFPKSRELILLLLPYGYIFFLVQLFQSFLRTQFYNREFAISSFIQTFLTFILTLLFVSKLGINGIAVSRIISMLISIFLFINIIRNFKQKYSYNYNLNKKEVKNFIVLSLALLASNIFSLIMPSNEAFLINNLIQDPVITANYKVSNLIPSQLPFVTTTIVIYYFPLVSKMKPNIKTWNYIKKIGLLTFIINLIITVVGTISSPLIIRLAYGDQYSNINLLMILLWWVHFSNSAFRILPVNLLPALGYIKYNLVLSAGSMLLLLIIDYILISQGDIYGAIAARALINMIVGVFYWIFLKRMCSIESLDNRNID